ncbi:MAG: cytosine/purine permease NCS1 family protein, partial [Bacillota bacterium]|nr:cytosine/purine permease NCS1 family protein [Bacillota bacterium]
TIVLTDYYVVRGKLKKGKQGIENLADIPSVNWNGLITLVLSTFIAMILYQLNWFSVPFIIATVLAFSIYTGLSYLKNQKTIPSENNADDFSG